MARLTGSQTVSETIFEEVAADLASEGKRLWHSAEAVFGHGRYHSASRTENVPEEQAMDFDPAELATDIRTRLQAAEDGAGEVYNHVKAILEERLPQVEAVVASVGSDPLFKLAYDDTIPAPGRALIAEIGAKIKELFPAQAPAQQAAPAEGDATQGTDQSQTTAA
jgi:hypothetical protein